MPRSAVAWRRIFAGPLLVCLLFGMLAANATPALAKLSYAFDGQLAPSGGEFGLLREPNSVAIDDASGDTYVADSSSGIVYVFETSTARQLASWNGSALTNPPGTPATSFGGEHVAVAANDGTGDVYVLDPTDNVVDELDSAGDYIRQFTHGFNAPSGITVDQATGAVYVVDANNDAVDAFSAEGVYLPSASISLAPVAAELSTSEAHGIAIDDNNGEVYVTNPSPAAVFEFNAATGGYETTWTGSNTPATSFGGAAVVGVAADNASGDVYVTSSASNVIDVFGPGGEYLASQSGHSFTFLRGIATDQESHRIDVADGSIVEVLGPAVVVPEVITTAATEVRSKSAVLNGMVSPAGLPVTDCHFDYVPSAQFQVSGFEDLTASEEAPCEHPDAAELGEGPALVEVHATVTGLHVGTTYDVRLQAENAHAVPSLGEAVTFDTQPPPSITGTSVSNLAAASVDLNAQINPNGLEITSCSFEYGISTAYGSPQPCNPPTIAAGSQPVAVTQHLEGLSPNITYHWRVRATSEAGTNTSADHTFIYPETGGGLPDHRAYEMVTPVQKNGAVIADATFAQPPDISEDGSRVILSSIQCFGGALSCTGSRHVTGSPYQFTRTAGGWMTTPLSPPASQFEANTSWAVSAQAETALFSMPTPPDDEDDFYARTPGGEFHDIGPLSPPANGPQYGRVLLATEEIAATEDLSHVVYQTDPVWPFSENPLASTSLFEYPNLGRREPALVGVSGGPESTELISACATKLGSGAHHENALSETGRIVYFTAAGSNGGGPCPGTGQNTNAVLNELYARVDESETVKISGAEPAEFLGASADGSRVFFTEAENLYEDELVLAPETASGKRVLGTTLRTVSAGDTSGNGPQVQGVMAISSDGTHVYFVAKGVLTSAANSRGETAQAEQENLYAFEREPGHASGHTAFIAALPESDSEEWQGTNAPGDPANVTPEGRFLVFTSSGALTPDVTRTDGAQQVFRYDAQSGELVRVSTGEHGYNDDGNAGPGNASIAEAWRTYDRAGPGRPDPTMSDDGSYVFFDSPVALTQGALASVSIGTFENQLEYAQNVYEWHEGNVYLISDGRDTSAASAETCPHHYSAVCLLGSDASGHNVFFTTTDQLVRQDTDTELDVYDARICEPEKGNPCIQSPPLAPPPCSEEACHSAPPPTFALLTFGSASLSGDGNVAPAARPVKPKTAAQIKAEKLAKALKLCRKDKSKKRREACERDAQKRYGAQKTKKLGKRTRRPR